jgi:hypothetical protein
VKVATDFLAQECRIWVRIAGSAPTIRQNWKRRALVRRSAEPSRGMGHIGVNSRHGSGRKLLRTYDQPWTVGDSCLAGPTMLHRALFSVCGGRFQTAYGNLNHTEARTQTVTVGANGTITPHVINELRFN